MAYFLKIQQIECIDDAGKYEADLGGKNFGAGIGHDRFDFEDPQKDPADGAEKTVRWIKKTTNKKINGQNPEHPFKWGE